MMDALKFNRTKFEGEATCHCMTVLGHAVLFDPWLKTRRHCVGEDSDFLCHCMTVLGHAVLFIGGDPKHTQYDHFVGVNKMVVSRSKLNDARRPGSNQTIPLERTTDFVPPGTPDNSPPFQRWARYTTTRQVPSGTKGIPVGAEQRSMKPTTHRNCLSPPRGLAFGFPRNPPRNRWATIGRPLGD